MPFDQIDCDDRDFRAAMELRRRHVSEEQIRRFDGVAVYLEAHHLCTQMRGVRELSPKTRTTNWRGEYDSSPALRAEFFVTCGLQR